MVDSEIDQFVGKLVNQNDCLRITIPKRLVDFAGMKADDIVKIWIKKINENTHVE